MKFLNTNYFWSLKSASCLLRLGAGASWDTEWQHKGINTKDFPTTNSPCINVKKGTTQGHYHTKSHTLHTSIVLSIFLQYVTALFCLNSSREGDTFRLLQLQNLRHSDVQPCTTFHYRLYPICIPKNLPAALLGSLGTAPESAPRSHTAPKTSLVAQGQRWKIQHLTRACTNAEIFVPLATIKHSPCPGLQAGLAGVAGGVQLHLQHRRAVFFPMHKLEHKVKYSTAQWAALLPFLWLSRVVVETTGFKYFML